MPTPAYDLIPNPDERPVLAAGDVRRIFDYGSLSAAYRAMNSGDLPTIRVRRRLFVSTARLRDMLGMPA